MERWKDGMIVWWKIFKSTTLGFSTANKSIKFCTNCSFYFCVSCEVIQYNLEIPQLAASKYWDTQTIIHLNLQLGVPFPRTILGCAAWDLYDPMKASYVVSAGYLDQSRLVATQVTVTDKQQWSVLSLWYYSAITLRYYTGVIAPTAALDLRTLRERRVSEWWVKCEVWTPRIQNGTCLPVSTMWLQPGPPGEKKQRRTVIGSYLKSQNPFS